MKINLNKQNGQKEVNEIVWICDYRHLNISQKAIRHIKPTKGMLTSKQTFYGYQYVFVPFKKNGELKSKAISLYDNTYSQIPVKLFSSEEECRKCYKEMAKIVLDEFEHLLNNTQHQFSFLKSQFAKL